MNCFLIERHIVPWCRILNERAMKLFGVPILILAILFLPSLCPAQAFRWTDESGGVHFTDDYLQVPEKHRKGVERVGLDAGSDAAGGAGTASPKKEVAPADRMGRGEEYWRRRVEEGRTRLTLALEKVESLRLRYNDLTGKYNESRSSAERGNLRRERERLTDEIDRCRVEIEESRILLEKKIFTGPDPNGSSEKNLPGIVK
jgi:hypothetical protein